MKAVIVFVQRGPLTLQRSVGALALAGGKNGVWTLHDLRRTSATMMQAQGISLELIDRCQNRVLLDSKVQWEYMHHHNGDAGVGWWCAK